MESYTRAVPFGCAAFAAVLVCYGLAVEPAYADSCSARFGGSCRTETFVLKTVSEDYRPARMVRQSHLDRPKKSRVAQETPAPRRVAQLNPKPRPYAARDDERGTNPRTIVEESFNVITSEDFDNAELAEGLKQRQQTIAGERIP